MIIPFIGQIVALPYNFAPTGWAQCDGRLLPIGQNTTLFSLLGTTYGGDGQTTFALPNLNGPNRRAVAGMGQGPGLSARVLGETAGSDSVSLQSTQMPQHNHSMTIHTGAAGTAAVPTASTNLVDPLTNAFAAAATTTLAPTALASAGAGQPHNNAQPYLELVWCIALQGESPLSG